MTRRFSPGDNVNVTNDSEEESYLVTLLQFISSQAIQILEGAIVTHNIALLAFHELKGVDILIQQLGIARLRKLSFARWQRILCCILMAMVIVKMLVLSWNHRMIWLQWRRRLSPTGCGCSCFYQNCGWCVWWCACCSCGHISFKRDEFRSSGCAFCSFVRTCQLVLIDKQKQRERRIAAGTIGQANHGYTQCNCGFH